MNINQYSPTNFSDVDLQQLINEPEMFPFNWETEKKIYRGYMLTVFRDASLGHICVWVLFIHNPQKKQLAKAELGLSKAKNRAIKHRTS